MQKMPAAIFTGAVFGLLQSFGLIQYHATAHANMRERNHFTITWNVPIPAVPSLERWNNSANGFCPGLVSWQILTVISSSGATMHTLLNKAINILAHAPNPHDYRDFYLPKCQDIVRLKFWKSWTFLNFGTISVYIDMSFICFWCNWDKNVLTQNSANKNPGLSYIHHWAVLWY